MELQKLQRVVVDALEDIKAQDIKVFNTVGQSDMFDRVVVATGTSNRQTRALAWHVVQKVKEAGGTVTSVEGTDPGEWVLVDLGDIVVHLMQPNVRQYYALEEMWGTRPVRVKLAADRRPNLAPSEDEAPAKPAKAGKKAPARVAGKTAGRSAGKAATRTPARKAPAKSRAGTATPRSGAAAGSKRKGAAAKKAPARKAAGSRSAAKSGTRSVG
jgi:ribosome-associated protein